MAKGKKSIGIVVSCLAFIGVIALAWHAYAKRPEKTGEKTALNTTLSVGPHAEALMEVGIPPTLSAQLVEYPGFTVSFNADTHQPNYVAWELTGEESRSQMTSRRSSAFSTDTAVIGCPTTYDYRGSGYDRGHMAPAGDMKWDSLAMQSSFFLTNISPQAHDLNQGSWRVLEEKCRDWAVRDSAVVIVCGPIFGDPPYPTIGETGVAVPERYFKVVLALHANPPRAIGFVMPNSKVSGGIQACAVSVDEVEAITGFDFFAALPDDVEQQIEAECNFPRWSKKK